MSTFVQLLIKNKNKVVKSIERACYSVGPRPSSNDPGNYYLNSFLLVWRNVVVLHHVGIKYPYPIQ